MLGRVSWEYGSLYATSGRARGVQEGVFTLGEMAPQDGTPCLLRGRSSLSPWPFGEPFKGYLLGILWKKFLQRMPLSLNLLREPRNTDQNT